MVFKYHNLYCDLYMGETMVKKLTLEQIFGRLAEHDLVDNFDSESPQYIAWKQLYSFLPKGHISEHSKINDITAIRNNTIEFLEKIEKQVCPKVAMLSRDFFSINKKLQKRVAKHLINISKKGTVDLYVGRNVKDLFDNTDVNVKIFDGKKMDTIEFISVTDDYFFIEYPHT